MYGYIFKHLKYRDDCPGFRCNENDESIRYSQRFVSWNINVIITVKCLIGGTARLVTPAVDPSVY